MNLADDARIPLGLAFVFSKDDLWMKESEERFLFFWRFPLLAHKPRWASNLRSFLGLCLLRVSFPEAQVP